MYYFSVVFRKYFSKTEIATLTEDFVKLEEEDSYDELIEYSDDDQSVGILSESDDSQGSKSSRQLPDLMRTCKTKKCGCGKGDFLFNFR